MKNIKIILFLLLFLLKFVSSYYIRDLYEVEEENFDYNDELNNSEEHILHKRGKKKVIKKKIVKIVPSKSFKINEEYNKRVKVHKEPYYDSYGVDLNQYIIDGMENKAINNDTSARIEDWELYTPPCPNLHPVHYPNEILNPVCENIAVPFFKIVKRGYKYNDIPIILKLHNITSQMEKWEEWSEIGGNLPKYKKFAKSGNMEYLLNDEYHPYDYGYYNKEINQESDEEYYRKVIQSPMDEVPDPRRRRLFSMILFNSEFELLDLYLAQNYEIFDYFIIYESNSTFSGYSKPLYLTRTLLETNRYDKFRDKIIPVTLPVLNVETYNSRGPGFPREHLARREVIEKGLRAVNARHGDIFMHGDLDELPNPRLSSYLKKCGGWEHLLMGIGGGPKPMNEAKSYLYDKVSYISKNEFGEYITDHSLFNSISFTGFFYEYSFSNVEKANRVTFFHPDLTIFDARRALGQYPKYTLDGIKKNIWRRNNNNNNNNNLNLKKRSDNNDDKKNEYDPFLGYSYSDNTNDDKKGEGYLGESVRLSTNPQRLFENGKMIKFWKSSWHLSSFLPHIDHFLNKLSSYAHYNMYNKYSYKEKINRILSRIHNHQYIFGSKKTMDVIKVKIPTEKDEKEKMDIYSYQLWQEIKKEYEQEGRSEKFEMLNNIVLHEIPQQVWENPICYSYMLDRDFGFTKKLWWQIIPKEQWSTVDFSELDNEILKEISPELDENNEVVN